MRDLVRLRRSSTDRYVAGVCGGLGRHFDVDPVIFRVLFVVTTIMGPGLFAYVALWLIVPNDTDQRAIISLEGRSRSIGVAVIGIVALAAMLTTGWQGPNGNTMLIVLVLAAVAWFLSRRERSGAPGAQAGPPVGYGAESAPAYGASGASVAPATAEFAGTEYQTPVAAPQYAGQPQYGQPQYSQPQYGQTQYNQPRRLVPGYVPKPPNPKKRGPLLFGFTLAAIVLALGILGMVDIGGAQISRTAYPALALAVCGVALLIGSRYGRAGGIIALGVLSLIGLGAGSASERVLSNELNSAPMTADAVASTYHLDSGVVRVDLSGVRDPAELAGRSVEVSTEVGRVQVILPRGVEVRAISTVEGIGSIDVVGGHSSGADLSRHDQIPPTDSLHTDSQSTQPAAPLTLITSVGAGSIEVTR